MNAVAVRERVNAEEIHNERRDKDKRVHVASVHCPVKALTYLFNRRWGFEGIKRHKSYNLFSVRFCFLYEILRNLKPAAYTSLRIAVQHLMQLNRDIFVALMNQSQSVTVARNFLFISVPRHSLLLA